MKGFVENMHDSVRAFFVNTHMKKSLLIKPSNYFATSTNSALFFVVSFGFSLDVQIRMAQTYKCYNMKRDAENTHICTQYSLVFLARLNYNITKKLKKYYDSKLIC